MARQRERFERTDVPQPSHTRTVVSAVVVVVVFAALFISLSMFWNKADSYSTYNDSTLEDAVAENQKDAARFSLYHAMQTIDYGNTEVIVRINGLDTPHWQEDIRVCVAGGADGILEAAPVRELDEIAEGMLAGKFGDLGVAPDVGPLR